MGEFIPFQKIGRLSRDVIVTEKIDGTNGVICIGEDGSFLVGSRTRWITPQDDNYGFATWARAHRDELMLLGPGRHFGEWWGRGIQRNYARTEKIFSLFNVARWRDGGKDQRPACCSVVPILYEGPMEEYGVLKGVKISLQRLKSEGSIAAPGFMNPEGIVIFHAQSGTLFKKTFEKDDAGKGREPEAGMAA